MSDLVTLTASSDPLEAHTLKGRLEAEGIPAFIANEHFTSLAWGFSTASGSVDIKVYERDLERAKQILRALAEG